MVSFKPYILGWYRGYIVSNTPILPMICASSCSLLEFIVLSCSITAYNLMLYFEVYRIYPISGHIRIHIWVFCNDLTATTNDASQTQKTAYFRLVNSDSSAGSANICMGCFQSYIYIYIHTHTRIRSLFFTCGSWDVRGRGGKPRQPFSLSLSFSQDERI